jgi:hypothetical protein
MGPSAHPNAGGEVSMLTYVALRDSHGGAAGLCERLPSAPAMYAWFRTIRVPENRGPDEFVRSILDAIEAPAAPDWRAKLGPMHTNTLESRSELSQSKRTLLEALAANDGFRQYTARIVEAAAVLQAPLYVGKAQDLQRRIRQHLDPMSDLSVRLREAGIRIDDCTLAYAIVDDETAVTDSWAVEPRVLFLIEEIITRICRPGFVARPG